MSNRYDEIKEFEHGQFHGGQFGAIYVHFMKRIVWTQPPEIGHAEPHPFWIAFTTSPFGTVFVSKEIDPNVPERDQLISTLVHLCCIALPFGSTSKFNGPHAILRPSNKNFVDEYIHRELNEVFDCHKICQEPITFGNRTMLHDLSSILSMLTGISDKERKPVSELAWKTALAEWHKDKAPKYWKLDMAERIDRLAVQNQEPTEPATSNAADLNTTEESEPVMAEEQSAKDENSFPDLLAADEPTDATSVDDLLEDITSLIEAPDAHQEIVVASEAPELIKAAEETPASLDATAVEAKAPFVKLHVLVLRSELSPTVGHLVLAREENDDLAEISVRKISLVNNECETEVVRIVGEEPPFDGLAVHDDDGNTNRSHFQFLLGWHPAAFIAVGSPEKKDREKIALLCKAARKTLIKWTDEEILERLAHYDRGWFNPFFPTVHLHFASLEKAIDLETSLPGWSLEPEIIDGVATIRAGTAPLPATEALIDLDIAESGCELEAELDTSPMLEEAVDVQADPFFNDLAAPKLAPATEAPAMATARQEKPLRNPFDAIQPVFLDVKMEIPDIFDGDGEEPGSMEDAVTSLSQMKEKVAALANEDDPETPVQASSPSEPNDDIDEQIAQLQLQYGPKPCKIADPTAQVEASSESTDAPAADASHSEIETKEQIEDAPCQAMVDLLDDIDRHSTASERMRSGARSIEEARKTLEKSPSRRIAFTAAEEHGAEQSQDVSCLDDVFGAANTENELLNDLLGFDTDSTVAEHAVALDEGDRPELPAPSETEDDTRSNFERGIQIIRDSQRPTPLLSQEPLTERQMKESLDNLTRILGETESDTKPQLVRSGADIEDLLQSAPSVTLESEALNAVAQRVSGRSYEIDPLGGHGEAIEAADPPGEPEEVFGAWLVDVSRLPARFKHRLS